MDRIEARLDRLKALFEDTLFLSNKGLANEVGLYVFPYQPLDEMIVRSFIAQLKQQYAGRPDRRILHYDLYQVLLDILTERRVLAQLPDFERSRGRDAMLRQVQLIAKPETFVNRLKPADLRYGDIVLISGVGRVYPYVRSHNILNNLQHLFGENPVVLMYPGEYDGQQLKLFGRFLDDHYYRAFKPV